VADSECGPQLERALVDLTLQVGRTRIVDDLKALERRGTQGVVLRNLETNAEQPVSIGEVSGAIDARAGLEDELRTACSSRMRWPPLDQADHRVPRANLEPNLVFSRAETARRVRNAGEQVSTVSRVFRRGQVLIAGATP